VEDEIVGIEALWKRTAIAQGGRYFLLKWMIVGGVAHMAGMAMQLMMNLLMAPGAKSSLSMAVWISAISQALLAGALGWLIFGQRRPTLVWAAMPFAIMLMWLAGSSSAIGFLYPLGLLFALVLQVLLLRGVRQHPGWWVLASVVSTGVSSYGVLFVLNTLGSLTVWWTPQFGLPGWFNSYFLINSAMGSLDLAIQGAAFAWLMPPKMPVESARASE
jgi:hypothetical protein